MLKFLFWYQQKCFKPCLHVTSAFSSTSMPASNFVLSQWLMQRMGLGPILCVCVCVTIHSIQNFDVDANADVTCKQSFIVDTPFCDTIHVPFRVFWPYNWLWFYVYEMYCKATNRDILFLSKKNLLITNVIFATSSNYNKMLPVKYSSWLKNSVPFVFL